MTVETQETNRRCLFEPSKFGDAVFAWNPEGFWQFFLNDRLHHKYIETKLGGDDVETFACYMSKKLDDFLMNKQERDVCEWSMDFIYVLEIILQTDDLESSIELSVYSLKSRVCLENFKWVLNGGIMAPFELTQGLLSFIRKQNTF